MLPWQPGQVLHIHLTKIQLLNLGYLEYMTDVPQTYVQRFM